MNIVWSNEDWERELGLKKEQHPQCDICEGSGYYEQEITEEGDTIKKECPCSYDEDRNYQSLKDNNV